MTTVVRLRAPSPAAVSQLLGAPAPSAEPLSSRLRQLLGERLHAVLGEIPGRHRVDSFAVEREAAGFTAPFAWSARASRRVVGTAAARSCVADGTDLLTAARDELERLCDRAVRGLARRGALGAWLASEPQAVRALCAVEAATWAASLLYAVEPSVSGIVVGIADAWFEVPAAGVTMQARRDAITSQGSRLGLLRLRDGQPGPRAIEGLLVDGLVDALSAPERPLPSRVVGGWPDAGVWLSVDFDDEVAREAARVVVNTATRLAAGVHRRPAVPAAA